MNNPTKCAASTMHLPLPGRIRCGSKPSPNRDDRLCAQHGRRADQGQPNAPALEAAPTLSEIADHWEMTTAQQKRAAYHQAAAAWPELTMPQHQIAAWLLAWHQAHPEAGPGNTS